jgi:hypothetical protein
LDEVEEAIIEAIEDEVLAEAVEEVFTGEADVETLEAVSIALSEADDEVKEEFEAEVNVFEGSFDEYVPEGSRVNVEDRRVLVAVTATTTVVAAASPAASGGSGGSGGGGSGGSGSSRRRKWK